jgi:quinoprotein dehydrogenase-associated probable ABC transporter substrate-binding protein/PQQ-dependent catabolism-associated CXXCW motif protein
LLLTTRALAAAAVLVAASALSVGCVGSAAAADDPGLGELVDPNTLRVCADPNNLPYSNQAGEGFENKIAELLAKSLDREIAYTWFPQTIGFVRNTLGAQLCDVVIGITTTSQVMQNTNPYYRSTYVLLQRADDGQQVSSLHDIGLKDLRVGAIMQTPPLDVLAREGLLDHLVPYKLTVDTRIESPARDMVEDLAAGEIDVGLLWGPMGGYWAQKQDVPIRIMPLESEAEGERLDFRITMGLRRGEPGWEKTLNTFLAEHQAEIQDILLDYGVPLLDEQGKLISPKVEGGDAPGKKAEATVPEPRGFRMSDYRSPTPATLEGARTVTTAELETLMANGQPVVIDVLPAPREPKNRPEGSLWRPKPRDNIPGSVWLPNVGYGELSAEFERYFKDELVRLTSGKSDRTLVFYCQAGCWMSWNAAKRALAYGYLDVVWYPLGTDGWQAAGLPLEPALPVAMPDFLPLQARAETEPR